MKHEIFAYHRLEEIEQKVSELGEWLPFSDKLEILQQPLAIAGRTLPNRIVFQPMEGSDAL
ncbi:MAG: NADH:flavin oxidoreductase, partial [Clostridia bacterium]